MNQGSFIQNPYLAPESTNAASSGTHRTSADTNAVSVDKDTPSVGGNMPSAGTNAPSSGIDTTFVAREGITATSLVVESSSAEELISKTLVDTHNTSTTAITTCAGNAGKMQVKYHKGGSEPYNYCLMITT